LELINLIHKELPQIQCGRCDTPGCKQYAEAIAQGSPHDRCVPGGKETLNKLNDITAIQYEDVNDDYGPSIPNQKVKIIEEECIGCKKCIDSCPIDAITGGTIRLQLMQIIGWVKHFTQEGYTTKRLRYS